MKITGSDFNSIYSRRINNNNIARNTYERYVGFNEKASMSSYI